MLFKKDRQQSENDQDHAKKLGLSKIVYGLGLSARDALITFVASTAIAFGLIYKGQKEDSKGGFINKLAEMPDRLGTKIKSWLGVDRASKAGKALLLAAGVGTVVSWIAHLPGLVRGPQKIAEAERTFNDEIDANIALHRENMALTQTLKNKELELNELKNRKGSFVDRVTAPEAPAGNSVGL